MSRHSFKFSVFSFQFAAIGAGARAWAMALVCWLVTCHSPLITSSHGATITGPIIKADSTPYVGTILFRPLSTPLPIAPNIVTGGDFKVSTATDGTFSVDLQAGDYRVIIGADKGFLIDVPNDSATYTLISRITTALTWNSSIVPSTNLYATATSSTEGILKTYSTVGSPVVFTTNDLPTMGSYLTRHLITSAYTTLATLKAATVPSQNKQRIFVGGLATDGDGGGGWFTYDSTNSITSDGYMVVAPNSGPGRYLRVYGQEINPLWFGADPTGVADSTTAIQAALDFAKNPTYAYASTSGETAQSSLAVVVPSGSYKTTATLTVNGVEFRGKKGAIGGDYGAHTIFHSKHGGHFMLIDVASSPTNGACYVGDLFIVGYHETYQANKKSLAFASTNRLQIKVADADAPTLGSEVPRASYAFFYDNQGRYLGSGRVDSTSSSGGITTCFMQSGTDVYSTVTSGGGFLRATDKVVFSPLITDETGPSGIVGSFVDPAAAGPCAIYLRNTHATAVLPPPIVENIYATRFHCGLRIGPSIIGGRMGNLIFVNNRFAGIAAPRDFNTTDFHFTGQLYLSGLYRSDYGQTFINSIDNPALCYGTYGWWGVPTVCKVDQLLSEENAYAGVYFCRTLSQVFTQLQVDGCIRYGIVAGRGYATYASPTSNGDDNWARAGQAWIRSQLSALPYDTVHTNDRAAIKIENTDATKPPFLHFNSLSITDPGGGSADFDHGFSIPSGYNNRVSVTALIDRNGAQTTLWKSGTQQPEIGRPWLYTADDAVNGWYWDGTGWAYAANSGKTLSMGSGQLTVTSGSGTSMLVLTNTFSSNSLALNVGTRNVTLDDAANGTRIGYFGNSGSTVDWIMGAQTASGAARSSTLSGEIATGTDASAGSMVLIAPRGTGSSSVGGNWDFYVPLIGSSGSTAQSVDRTFRIVRGGQVNHKPMTTAPTVNVAEGDVYFDSSVPGLRVRQSGAWVTLGAAGSGGVVDGDKGDITATASGTTWTIDPNTVTYAKMQDVSAASRLLGRGSASGSGDMEEITLGTGLQLTGTVLQATIGNEIQAWDADLAALAALATGADKVPYFTGASMAALADFTSFGRTLVGSANASAARSSLGVAIGSQVQAYDAELAALAGVTSAADKLPYFTGSGTADVTDITAFARTVLAAPDQATTRTLLGLSATNGTVTSVSVTTTNGISGTVATPTSTPQIQLTLGAITPTSVNGVTISGSSTPTLAVTGTTSVSGVNTGDQTSVSGNAGTATALQTARTINGVSFDGTANITVPAAAGTLTGATLASGVTASSLTSFGSSPTIASPSITGHPTIEGVTSTGATGSGNLVFATSPTLTTPTLGTPTQANLANATNLPISTGVSGLGTGVATALATPSSANIFAAVTDETGSGSLVGSASPTFTGTIGAYAITQTGRYINSVNGALSAPAVSFTGTPITGGLASTTQGLVKIGSGASGNLSTSGTMLEVQAPAAFSGNLLHLGVDGASARLSLTSAGVLTAGNNIQTAGNIRLTADNSALTIGLANDVSVTRKAAANLQLGSADAASPVAQTLSVQSVVAGTTDTAGANWTINGSRGTGTGAGGSITWQVAPAGSSGSGQNSLVVGLQVYPRLTSTAVRFSGYGNSYEFYNFAGTSPITPVNSATAIGQAAYSRQGTETSNDYGFAFVGNNRQNTAGDHTDVVVQRGFSPTSGTATYAALGLTPTINQTGGASGTTWGIYINPTLTSVGGTFRAFEATAGDFVLPKTVTAAGTTGAQTINKITGSVNFAAAATSLVVTDSYVTANSIIMATVASNDTTMKSVAVVAGAGSFTIYPNAAPTAETRVNFFITN